LSPDSPLHALDFSKFLVFEVELLMALAGCVQAAGYKPEIASRIRHQRSGVGKEREKKSLIYIYI